MGNYSYSFGVTEMQVNTATRLLKDRGEEGTTRQALSWLGNNASAIDLTAQYLAELQKDIGTDVPYVLAMAYNLGAENIKKGKYSHVGNRSKYFQSEIKKALEKSK
jgi:hypothetical protein